MIKFYHNIAVCKNEIQIEFNDNFRCIDVCFHKPDEFVCFRVNGINKLDDYVVTNKTYARQCKMILKMNYDEIMSEFRKAYVKSIGA